MVEEGERAPDFELPDQDGQPVRLSSFRGRSVVLYFYPRADTPGCTTQACGLRDRSADLEAANAVVLGVSPDKPEALRKFADKYGLPFPLLADPDHEVLERYGAWGEKKLYGKTSVGVKRSTFLIGPDGVVTRAMRNVKAKGHDERIVTALSETGATA